MSLLSPVLLEEDGSGPAQRRGYTQSLRFHGSNVPRVDCFRKAGQHFRRVGVLRRINLVAVPRSVRDAAWVGQLSFNQEDRRIQTVERRSIAARKDVVARTVEARCGHLQ